VIIKINKLNIKKLAQSCNKASFLAFNSLLESIQLVGIDSNIKPIMNVGANVIN